MNAPEVAIATGRVRGIATEYGAAFLGIPYAQAAVGLDRFTAPRQRAPWDGTLNAVTHGPTALQAPYPAPMDKLLPSSVAPGDDYLNLSVWTPDSTSGGLPVIVWIHGGAFVRGANSIATYDGSAFARDGVVLVGINYRLGVPGFPALPDAPANLGLRDQLLALQWVQDNIAAFGGDPGRVTVMGESAGGMSVATLLAMPAARGLFAQAIVQSGGGVSAGAPDDLGTVTAEVARILAVEPTASALGAVDPAALLDAQTAATLALVTDPRPERWGLTTIRGGFGIMPTFPALDGQLLTDTPEALIAGGAGSGVPLLIGTTSQEFNLWSVGLGMAASVTAETLHPLLGRHGVPAGLVDSYLARRRSQSLGQVFSDVITDLLFREPSIRIAQSRSGGPASTFMYEFGWPTPEHDLGACHALELPFVFDTLGSGRSGMSGPSAPQQLATVMHDAWVRFAATGDPGWPAYDDRSRATRHFALEGPELMQDPRADDRRCWVAP